MKTQTIQQDNWLTALGSTLEQLQKDASKLEEMLESKLNQISVWNSSLPIGAGKTCTNPIDSCSSLPSFKIFWSVKNEDLFFEDKRNLPGEYLDDLCLLVKINLKRFSRNKGLLRLCAHKVQEVRERNGYKISDSLDSYLDPDKTKKFEEIKAEFAKNFVKKTILPKLIDAYKKLLTGSFIKHIENDGFEKGSYNIQALSVDQLVNLFKRDKTGARKLLKLFQESALQSSEVLNYFHDQSNFRKLEEAFSAYKGGYLSEGYFRGIFIQVSRYGNLSEESGKELIEELFKSSSDKALTVYEYSFALISCQNKKQVADCFVPDIVKTTIKEVVIDNFADYETRFAPTQEVLSLLLDLVKERQTIRVKSMELLLTEDKLDSLLFQNSLLEQIQNATNIQVQLKPEFYLRPSDDTGLLALLEVLEEAESSDKTVNYLLTDSECVQLNHFKDYLEVGGTLPGGILEFGFKDKRLELIQQVLA